jgi:poly-gamma-glutamate system protein
MRAKKPLIAVADSIATAIAGLAPFGRGFSRSRVRVLALALAAVLAVAGLSLAEGSSWVWTALRGRAAATLSKTAFYSHQVRAAEIMHGCTLAIAQERTARGISIDAELDPNGTGLIGAEFTPITTTLGVLEAKRTSTNPAFAALMVRYFVEAGLEPGDMVAVGASGSFPALILATLAACRALDLQPAVVYSIGASMYGANIPDFTFADMLVLLNQRNLLPYELSAVSLGGEGDAGGNGLFGQGAECFEQAATRSGVPVLKEHTIADSIRRRMEIFADTAERLGRPVACFVNIGGATANYGNTSASLDFPNGLVMQPTVMSAHPERGLVFEYAAMGVPIINLLDLRGLAIRNGLPVDPVPLPPPGEGGVYFTKAHSRPAAAVALLASASAVLAAAGAPRKSRQGTTA